LSSLLLAGTRGTHRRGPGRRPGPPAPRAAAANTHPLSAWPQRRSLSAADDCVSSANDHE